MPQRTFVAVLTACVVVVLVAGCAGPTASSASRPVASTLTAQAQRPLGGSQVIPPGGSQLPPGATQTPPGAIQTLPGAPPTTFGIPSPPVSSPATPSAPGIQPSLPLLPNGAPNRGRIVE